MSEPAALPFADIFDNDLPPAEEPVPSQLSPDDLAAVLASDSGGHVGEPSQHPGGSAAVRRGHQPTAARGMLDAAGTSRGAACTRGVQEALVRAFAV